MISSLAANGCISESKVDVGESSRIVVKGLIE